jgi:succinate dehydrogenase/fumarate reductase flavoprotein subunit
VLEVEDIILCPAVGHRFLERGKLLGVLHYRRFPKKDDENWRKHIMLRRGERRSGFPTVRSPGCSEEKPWISTCLPV